MNMQGVNDRQLLGKLKAFYREEAQEGALPPEWWEQALENVRTQRKAPWRFSPSRGPLWRLAWVALLLLLAGACSYAAATVVHRLDGAPETAPPSAEALMEYMRITRTPLNPELVQDWEPDLSQAELITTKQVGNDRVLVLMRAYSRDGREWLYMMNFVPDPYGRSTCRAPRIGEECSSPEDFFTWYAPTGGGRPVHEEGPTFVAGGPYVGYVNVDTEQTISYEAGWWRGRRTVRVEEPVGIIVLETWAKEVKPAQP